STEVRCPPRTADLRPPRPGGMLTSAPHSSTFHAGPPSRRKRRLFSLRPEPRGGELLGREDSREGGADVPVAGCLHDSSLRFSRAVSTQGGQSRSARRSAVEGRPSLAMGAVRITDGGPMKRVLGIGGIATALAVAVLIGGALFSASPVRAQVST